jgi:hypothetical protein
MDMPTMRLPSTMLLLAMAWVCQAQPTNCRDFRNGVFRIDDTEHGMTTIITRTGGKQRERMGDSETTLKVVWLNDCTYTLEPIKRKRVGKGAEPVGGFDPTIVIKVEILETGSDHYIQRSTAALYSLVYTSRVDRLK